jgi:putative transposase
LILNTWKQHPLLGPSQIKNQLRRLGYKMSVNTVRNLMEEHGYVTPKTKRKEHLGSYEAVRPRQLYHLDFFHLHVHKQKQVLLLIEDDFSRFIAGWTLVETENADAVIDALEKSVARYGKPEAVMSDRGSAFYSWSGVTRFENLLVEYGIDYFVARLPQTNGKIEALNATVQRELIRKIEFVDLTDAARHIAQWVHYYNFERTHHALGGILVPADRFLGCVEEMMARIHAGEGTSPLELLAGAQRVLEAGERFRPAQARSRAGSGGVHVQPCGPWREEHPITRVAHAVAVAVGLIGVGHRGAVVGAVGHAVIVVIEVAQRRRA